MTNKSFNVLFICSGNSARSIMAEALLKHMGGDKFNAHSAGSHASGKVNPYALEIISSNRLTVQGLRSKNWEEFSKPGAPVLDFVITVCDKAAGEVCPVWPGQPMTAHWGVAEPSSVQGTEEEKRKAFAEAFLILNRRISLFTSLPIEKLDTLALKRELDHIGKVSSSEKPA